jgi:hypothetical protein
MKTTGNSGMTVKEAAQALGKSQQFMRAGLQYGILPFGVAIKMSTRWTYYISRERLKQFIDGTLPVDEEAEWVKNAKNNLGRNNNE